jgi:hypothetical protein
VPGLIQPFPEAALEAFTVPPLLGKQAIANTVEAHTPFDYPELALLG